MKSEQTSSDSAIDRVMAGLAGVEAPPEIEHRVLQAVRRRAAEQERPKFAALSTLTHWQPWAVAACVVLSFAASRVVQKRHEPGHEDAVLNRHSLPNITAAAQMEEAEAPPRQPALVASPHRKNQVKAEVLSDEEALAISEMLAPSKPAPPLPLTHQEKLLAEAVHQDGTAKLSSLRPEVVARQMELSKAEFRDFFEPSSAKDNE